MKPRSPRPFTAKDVPSCPPDSLVTSFGTTMMSANRLPKGFSVAYHCSNGDVRSLHLTADPQDPAVSQLEEKRGEETLRVERVLTPTEKELDDIITGVYMTTMIKPTVTLQDVDWLFQQPKKIKAATRKVTQRQRERSTTQRKSKKKSKRISTLKRS